MFKLGKRFPNLNGCLKPNQLLASWKKLNSSQKGTLISVFVLALMLPIAVFASYFQTTIRSRANLRSRSYLATPSAEPTQIEPSPTITAIPATPTTKPTAVPSPTPLPTAINHPPVITSNSLPKGQVGLNYNAVISGMDQDIGDLLQMNFTNLPPGITKGECQTQASNNLIRCIITGIPTQTGLYAVGIALSDNHGGLAQKVIGLTIKPN